MCMPGLKTADGRGIAVLRHGPRMPYFLDRLEERLVRDGLVLRVVGKRKSPLVRTLSHGSSAR